MEAHWPTINESITRISLLAHVRPELSRWESDFERYIAYQVALEKELQIFEILDQHSEEIDAYNAALSATEGRYMELADSILDTHTGLLDFAVSFIRTRNS